MKKLFIIATFIIALAFLIPDHTNSQAIAVGDYHLTMTITIQEEGEYSVVTLSHTDTIRDDITGYDNVQEIAATLWDTYLKEK